MHRPSTISIHALCSRSPIALRISTLQSFTNFFTIFRTQLKLVFFRFQPLLRQCIWDQGCCAFEGGSSVCRTMHTYRHLRCTDFRTLGTSLNHLHLYLRGHKMFLQKCLYLLIIFLRSLEIAIPSSAAFPIRSNRKRVLPDLSWIQCKRHLASNPPFKMISRWDCCTTWIRVERSVLVKGDRVLSSEMVPSIEVLGNREGKVI